MPTFPFVFQRGRERGDPLGPQTVNQMHANVDALDELARMEHFADGKHNAVEVPWVVGKVDDGSPPTGYLFDTAYGGGTLARPGTGEYTCSVVSGVVSLDDDGNALYSALANVCDSAIEAKPHTITVEPVSDTSFKFRVRALTSALGAGDTWADVNRDFEIALHALAQPIDASVVADHTQKLRRDRLTETVADWNALVANQGVLHKASLVEHNASGEHLVHRIAKAVAWCSFDALPSPAYSLDAASNVTSVTRISQGVVEMVMHDQFLATSGMICFPEVQPALTNELVIINGRAISSGGGTSAFRFYIYAFDGANWSRADRSFNVAVFGETDA